MLDKHVSKTHWTESAIECYEREYNCVGCPTQELISEKCKMKNSVLNLIQIKGLPPKDDLFPEFKNQPLKIMKAIYNGAGTLEELVSELGTTRQGIINCLNAEIFPVYETKGFIRPKQNGFPAFIDFFKGYIVSENQFLKNDSTEEKIMFDEDLKLNYADFLKPLVEAVKRGFESYDDLVCETGLNKHQISVYWINLLNPWIKSDLISRNPEKTQKQEVIDFIRNRLIDVQNGNIEENKQPEKLKLKGKIEIKKKPAESIQKIQLQKDDFLSNQPLTEMEQTVLNLLLAGLNYQQIAEKIPIALTTVKTHVNNIFTKRNYHSLQELLVTEFKKKNNLNIAEASSNNRLQEELNQTKLLLEGKNAQYNSLLNEKKELEKQIREIKESSKFTLFTPIEQLSLKYKKQIDEWQTLINQTKLKLEVLKELNEVNNAR